VLFVDSEFVHTTILYCGRYSWNFKPARCFILIRVRHMSVANKSVFIYKRDRRALLEKITGWKIFTFTMIYLWFSVFALKIISMLRPSRSSINWPSGNLGLSTCSSLFLYHNAYYVAQWRRQDPPPIYCVYLRIVFFCAGP